MAASADLYIEIFACSACFWLLCALFKLFSVSRFIVNRYEHETDLLNSVYFKEHFTFTRYMYNMKSASMYSAHLILCTWGWRYFGQKKLFRDIQDPKQITRHFSAKEIKRVKRCMIYGMIVFLHGIAYFVFRYIWPEAFS